MNNKELRMYLDENTHSIKRFACFTWYHEPEKQEKPVMLFSHMSILDMINIRDYMDMLLKEFEKDPSQLEQYKVD